LDWERALARTYRGRMPYSWRAYRINPAYYARLSSQSLTALLALGPIALCAMGYLLDRIRAEASLDVVPYLHPPVVALALAIFAAMILRTMRPRLREARSNLALVTDRSEIVIITPEGSASAPDHRPSSSNLPRSPPSSSSRTGRRRSCRPPVSPGLARPPRWWSISTAASASRRSGCEADRHSTSR
jgi:hypothetical protein